MSNPRLVTVLTIAIEVAEVLEGQGWITAFEFIELYRRENGSDVCDRTARRYLTALTACGFVAKRDRLHALSPPYSQARYKLTGTIKIGVNDAAQP